VLWAFVAEAAGANLTSRIADPWIVTSGQSAFPSILVRVRALRPLEGQVAVVTGASKGIGEAAALALSEAGASVVVAQPAGLSSQGSATLYAPYLAGSVPGTANADDASLIVDYVEWGPSGGQPLEDTVVQIIFPIQADIWTKGNRYNIVTDWRYLKYPSFTYGLGGNTSTDSGYSIDYSYLRLHQAILKTVSRDLYLGIGYDLDYFWNVEEIDPPPGKATDFEMYGFHKKEVASGVSLHFLYDSRRNQINPDQGGYFSVAYRPNFTFLGSDANWQSLILDLRKYWRFPGSTRNVLALWSYDWFTTGSGNPPYLLLPSTGWDAYSNTARGYIQGRFRSKNMLYLETEYRFRILSNGLLGGVIFGNAQSVSEQGSGRFEYVTPGYGTGLRISLNKFSRTNLCIDYGWGTHGSGGFFVNLGEVF